MVEINLQSIADRQELLYGRLTTLEEKVTGLTDAVMRLDIFLKLANPAIPPLALYDALRSGKVSEDKARAAALEVAERYRSHRWPVMSEWLIVACGLAFGGLIFGVGMLLGALAIRTH